MFSSFQNGITGMRTQMTRTNTTANNIANLNTNGFKENEVSFKDIHYRNLKLPGMPVSSPVSLGGGVSTAGTQKNFSNGTLFSTNRQLDFAISGDGFFCVEKSEGDKAYTRDGSFQIDSDGFLVNQNGCRLFPHVRVPEGMESLQVDPGGKVEAVFPDGSVQDSGRITVHHVPNPEGLESIGNNLYRQTQASGTVSQGVPGDASGEIRQGMLEQSNVDLNKQMSNMIMAQRAFQINSRVVRMADEMFALANQLRR